MRPGYWDRIGAYRTRPSTMKTVAVRAPILLMQELGMYALHENDKISNLVREGILRVIDDRRADNKYMAGLDESKQDTSTLEEQRANFKRIMAEVAETTARRNIFGPPETPMES